MSVEEIRSRLSKLQERADPNFAATDGEYFDHACETEDLDLDLMYRYFQETLSDEEEGAVRNYLNLKCERLTQISLRDMIDVGRLVLYKAMSQDAN